MQTAYNAGKYVCRQSSGCDVPDDERARAHPPIGGNRRGFATRQPVAIPASPEDAVLETVANPHADETYLVRFTCPEFTTLCPVTGQPDFAHLVFDYVPAALLVESKSLKLYLASFRDHRGFHEDCTLAIAKKITAAAATAVAAHRRLLVSARRHPDRHLLADGSPAPGAVAPRAGGCAYRGRG